MRTLTRRRLVLGGVAGVGLLVGLVVWAVFSWRTSRTVPVTLGEVRVTIVFENAHPFLAEYTRSAAVDAAGRSFVVTLPDDTGGGLPMEVRLHREAGRAPVLVFTGGDDAAIDLATGERILWDEGKFGRYPADDPRLPPLERAVTIGKDFGVRQAVQR